MSFTLGQIDGWVKEALTGLEGHEERWLYRRLTGMTDAKLTLARVDSRKVAIVRRFR